MVGKWSLLENNSSENKKKARGRERGTKWGGERSAGERGTGRSGCSWNRLQRNINVILCKSWRQGKRRGKREGRWGRQGEKGAWEFMTSLSPIRVAPPMHLSPGESAAQAFTACLHSTHTWCGVVATRDLIIRASTCRVLLPTLQARRWYLISEQLRKCNSVPGDSKDAMQWPLSHPRGCYTQCCILYILQPKGQCFYMAGHPAGDRRLNPRQTSIWLLFCGQAHIFWEKFQFWANAFSFYIGHQW